jgi:hypothetical protein
MGLLHSRATVGAALSLAMVGTGLVATTPAWANHPVYVEGNCLGPGAGTAATGLQTSPVSPGTCGDYDGDGNIGDAEDNDGDNNYGSIGAAVDAVGNNGRVTIVANGIFPEVVRLAPTGGANISLEAAPGVDANIDAVVQGQPGNAERQQAPGIVIDGCDDCRVTVRNVMTRNWTDGVLILGRSHVALDEVRAENNINYGIHASSRARVAIRNSDVNATGFRADANGPATPNPGTGIRFAGRSKGSVYDTTVTGSFLAGISGIGDRVKLRDNQVFDNGVNFMSEEG